jgi:hypothetical protein
MAEKQTSSRDAVIVAAAASDKLIEIKSRRDGPAYRRCDSQFVNAAVHVTRGYTSRSHAPRPAL